MAEFCRCAEPMPVPDTTGESEIGSMCFGCDRPMDEESCIALYEDGVAEQVLRALAAAFPQPRTWRVRCPGCNGRPTRTEGAWTATESPRVVWTCPTCEGVGDVEVQLAPDPTEEKQ